MTPNLIFPLLMTSLIAVGQNQITDKLDFYLKNANYVKLCELASEVIAKDSLQAHSHFYYGLCKRKNGEYDLAFKHLTQSITIDNKNSKAYAELGNIYAMTGDYEKALSNYDLAINLDQTNLYAYNSKGALYYLFLNDDSLALLNFRKALSLDPNNILAIYNMGIFIKYKEQYHEAIEYLSRVIKLNNKFYKAYDARATCYYYLDKNKKAIKDYKKALKYNTTNDPYDKLDNVEIYKWISKCYNELGNKKKADLYFKMTEK